MKHGHPKMGKVSVSDTGTGTTQLPACPIGVHSKKIVFFITTQEGHGSDTDKGKKEKKKNQGDLTDRLPPGAISTV